MTRYVWQGGRWVDVSCETSRPNAFPYIISDHMPPLRHMATGEVFDSKSQFRAATRAAGCVELGNDADPHPREYVADNALRADIKEAITQLEQGRSAPTPALAGPYRDYG